MYSLSRLILILAVATYGYCGIVLAVIYSPISWYVVVPLVLLFLTRSKTRMNLTAHGSAFWASERDLEDARMIDGKPGRLPLGRLIGGGRPGLLDAVNGLLDWRKKTKRACREFFAALRGKKTPALGPDAAADDQHGLLWSRGHRQVNRPGHPFPPRMRGQLHRD